MKTQTRPEQRSGYRYAKQNARIIDARAAVADAVQQHVEQQTEQTFKTFKRATLRMRIWSASIDVARYYDIKTRADYTAEQIDTARASIAYSIQRAQYYLIVNRPEQYAQFINAAVQCENVLKNLKRAYLRDIARLARLDARYNDAIELAHTQYANNA